MFLNLDRVDMDFNKPLFLIGLRASGKTALGQILSQKLFLPLFDTDLMVQNVCGENIAKIIDSHGWEFFREKESAVLRTIPFEKSIVSTGGGIVLDADNRAYLKQNGICIFLDPPIQILCDRLKKNPLSSQRPAFSNESIEEEVVRIHKERKELYLEIADFRVDSSRKIEIIVQQILNHLDIS